MDHMVRIVSDTSTLYSSTQAQEAGFAVSPLSVTINGKSYREFDEISSEDFVAIIREGHLPVSSQPAVGEVLDLYQQYPEDEIVNISMAAGLSGTYDSAVSAAGLCDHRDRITVINTRTLCGPHRYLVEKAVEWAKNGHSAKEIRVVSTVNVRDLQKQVDGLSKELRELDVRIQRLNWAVELIEDET